MAVASSSGSSIEPSLDRRGTCDRCSSAAPISDGRRVDTTPMVMNTIDSATSPAGSVRRRSRGGRSRVIASSRGARRGAATSSLDPHHDIPRERAARAARNSGVWCEWAAASWNASEIMRQSDSAGTQPLERDASRVPGTERSWTNSHSPGSMNSIDVVGRPTLRRAAAAVPPPGATSSSERMRRSGYQSGGSISSGVSSGKAAVAEHDRAVPRGRCEPTRSAPSRGTRWRPRRTR